MVLSLDAVDSRKLMLFGVQWCMSAIDPALLYRISMVVNLVNAETD